MDVGQSDTELDCPRAKTWMTPCIARDGGLAVADDGVCVGCGEMPRALLDDLAKRYQPAHDDLHLADPKRAADALTAHVHAYVDGK
jgi:hypothetical protein